MATNTSQDTGINAAHGPADAYEKVKGQASENSHTFHHHSVACFRVDMADDMDCLDDAWELMFEQIGDGAASFCNPQLKHGNQGWRDLL